ncbi:hypothetical protein ACJX0J_011077, partial [Zea mays]
WHTEKKITTRDQESIHFGEIEIYLIKQSAQILEADTYNIKTCVFQGLIPKSAISL